jgi:hypothetical protein
MTGNACEPHRLRESTARSDSANGRLARHLRILSVDAPLPQLRRYPTSAQRGRCFLIVARVGILASVLLMVASGATAAAAYIIRHFHSTAPVEPVEDTTPAVKEKQQKPRAQRGHVARAAVDTPTEPTTGAPLPEEPPVPMDQPQHPRLDQPQHAQRLARHAGGAVVEPAPEPKLPVRTEGIAEEAVLLRQALAAIRQSRDPQRALTLLDDYDTRFPRGTLAREASAARAQALLLSGDKSAALAILDRLPLEQDHHTGELRVIRGELRSLFGRCTEALLDFEAVLRRTAGMRPEDGARALDGRASCRARTGDLSGAEQDRRRYLNDYPQGPAADRLRSSP